MLFDLLTIQIFIEELFCSFLVADKMNGVLILIYLRNVNGLNNELENSCYFGFLVRMLLALLFEIGKWFMSFSNL
jgi:hypothetical protein